MRGLHAPRNHGSGCQAPCPTLRAVTVQPQACTGTKRLIVLDAEIEGGHWRSVRLDFGDGSTQSLPAGDPGTSHLYPAPGQYTATLTMRGPGSCSESRATVKFDVRVVRGSHHQRRHHHLLRLRLRLMAAVVGVYCGFLFKAAVILIVAAAIAIFVAGCLWLTPYHLVSAVVAAVLVALAFAAFLLWAKVCARLGELQEPTQAVGLPWLGGPLRLTVTGAILTVLALVGIAPEALPCGIGALVSGGYIATVRNTVHDMAVRLGCHPWRDGRREGILDTACRSQA